MLTSCDVGVVAPIMYYLENPKMIWCAGVKRNMMTSKTTYIGNGQIDEGQFLKPFECNDCPNAFMVRRKIMEDESILFDERNFPWMYEESDFCYKVKEKGWKVILLPTAKVWHDVTRSEGLTHTTEVKAYFLGKNRILFHKKYGKLFKFLIFILFFFPIFTVMYIFWYIWKGIKERNLSLGVNLSKSYTRGVIKGVKEMIARGKNV
jgi:GT2 family glycosyltransferase